MTLHGRDADVGTFSHRFLGGSMAEIHYAAAVTRRLALLAAVAACCPTATRAAGIADAPGPIPAKLQLITEFFDNEVAAGRLPGAVVFIQQHGRPVYLMLWRTRCRDQVADDARYDFAIRSMTKPITSVAAMMLIDAGKLSLDDPVCKVHPVVCEHEGWAGANRYTR